MLHPEVENRTPFAFEALLASDEAGRPLVVPISKATYDILPGGSLDLADLQKPVDFEGSSNGEPGASSLRVEPEVAFAKPATDVVMVGHAHALRGQTVVDVELAVGSLAKRVRVTGDRVWTQRLGTPSPSPPLPFEKIPLVYERSNGGWDRSPADAHRHDFHPGNPVGVGYRTKHSRFIEGAPLPNVEDPAAPLTSYQGRGVPAGFGFISPHWESRRLFAGTYDAAWARERMPLLPRDFDRRHHVV